MLRRHFQETHYDAAIPVGLEMAALFERHRTSLPVPTMLPPSESFRTALDKKRTFEHAAALGIPIPKTLAAANWRELGLPVVFKHPRTGAWIVRSAPEVEAVARRIESGTETHIAQEYIPGENGFGYFGFFQNGRETAYFMHERLMQYPREGGPSVVARSIHDTRLRELGKTLLASLDWHGAAMVEFKRHEGNGEFYLMEINPKLWGSLDLAIVSGCNFPVWIANALIDGSSPPATSYPDGVTYQWLLPVGLKAALRYPEFRGAILRNVISSKIKSDWRWSDPLPTFAELYSMLANAVKR
ncbi:MAG: hypothetical protein M3R35_04095 [Candidatus Eremiobacteraeota bacterium]|nr:hypothetical protein [Candidatus Eremiobacteraeota bacterium]